jgi:orotate phosphoribosyltransferase
MQQYKKDFIQFLVRAGALKFGEFTLKSGRVAPYFFNAGNFYTGQLMFEFAKAYAGAIVESKIEADVIFGPAYKGIPLCVATSTVLHSEFGQNIAYAYNRKEQKQYGEKDLMVGAPINQDTRVLLIDDVITAGTAIRDVMNLLKENGNPKMQGVLICLNRMEKNNDGENAIEALEKDFGFKVHAIVTLDDLIEVLYNKEIDGKIYIDDNMMQVINDYRAKYGI